jgi:aconitase B
MRVLYILSCIIVLFSCKEKCAYPVSFQVSYVNEGTKIQLDLDSGKVEKSIELADGFYMGPDKRKELVRYCSSNKLNHCKMQYE